MKILIAALFSGALMLQAAPPVPRPATPFMMTEPSGQKTDITSYKGKVVVAQFLYTWCSHCQATAKMLTKLQTEFGPKGLQVVGIAFNDEPSGATPAVDANETAKFKAGSAGFPVGFTSRTAVLQYLGISVMERYAVPQIMVIDRKGVIRAQDKPMPTPELQSESYLRNLVTKLLEEKGTTEVSKATKEKAPPTVKAATK